MSLHRVPPGKTRICERPSEIRQNDGSICGITITLTRRAMLHRRTEWIVLWKRMNGDTIQTKVYSSRREALVALNRPCFPMQWTKET